MKNWTIFISETTFNFGKHKGDTLELVAQSDAPYILWCFRNIDKFLISEELLTDYQNKYPCILSGTTINTGEYFEFDMNKYEVTQNDLELLKTKWEDYEEYIDMMDNADYDYFDDYSVGNNPYYNDNLDMDQQDPEFWDWF
jgi:hypothetical protein